MIAYLSGTILQKLEKSVIINTGNVGYLVSVSPRIIETLEIGQKTEFLIYTKVREDDISLFGFQSQEEINLFKKLIEIQGIGPKSAMEIISVPLPKLKAAILNEDVKMLTQLPGIGKKSAERIILEMKNKISPDSLLLEEKIAISEEEVSNEDAMDALLKLGYDRHIVVRSLKKIPEEIKTAEDIIKYFLQNLS